MPVKEVTVFKDGHAFVRHEGSVATNENGDVVLDYLPRPVVGTFWAYSADGDIKLKSATAAKKLVSIDRTALSIPELIEANVGIAQIEKVIFIDTPEEKVAQPPPASSSPSWKTPRSK